MAKFNLNLSDLAYADVTEMAERSDISLADAFREAFSLLRFITREIADGNRLLVQLGDQVTELVVPLLERFREPVQPK